MKTYTLSGIALLLMISLLLIPGQVVAGRNAPKESSKTYILSIDQAKSELALNTILKTHKNIGAKRFTTLSKYTGRDYYVVKIKDTEKDIEKQFLKLSQTIPGVTFSPNTYRYLDSAWPNDPEFAKQWCHANGKTQGFDMASKAAWKITTGSSDIVVAVLDSGVDYLHPDLAPNMWINENEIRNTWGSSEPDADFDGSSNVDMNDFNIFRNRWSTQAPFE